MCFSEILQPDIYPSNSSEYEEGKMEERGGSLMKQQGVELHHKWKGTQTKGLLEGLEELEGIKG